MDSNWSIKKLHRLIAPPRPIANPPRHAGAFTRDLFNRLLARGPRFRVEGEIVRDIALTSSGLLNPALGGRQRVPARARILFQPPVSYGPKDWPVSTGPDRYRRSLTSSASAPCRIHCCKPTRPMAISPSVRRGRSNTPLQALVSLNETTFMECARPRARKTLTAEGGKSDADKINFAFRRAPHVHRPIVNAKNCSRCWRSRKITSVNGWVNAPNSRPARTSHRKTARRAPRRPNSPPTPSSRACC